MLGAVMTGFLGQKFRMKNVLAFVYGIRVLIAVSFIVLPKSVPFAFIATGILGLTGDSTVPPTTGIISRKVGVAKMAVVYGSIFIGHQIGAFVQRMAWWCFCYALRLDIRFMDSRFMPLSDSSLASYRIKVNRRDKNKRKMDIMSYLQK